MGRAPPAAPGENNFGPSQSPLIRAERCPAGRTDSAAGNPGLPAHVSQIVDAVAESRYPATVGRRIPWGVENRVRALRESRGWPQAELARACGLSRQALSAIESGRYVPNTAVSLRLAQALGCAVEDLFVPAAPQLLEAVLAEGSSSHGRVRLGRVRSRLVAWPLRGQDASLPADGTVVRSVGRRARIALLRGAGNPDEVLLVAGCDPAVRLAGLLAQGRGAVHVHWVALGSARALRAAREGLVHAAGTHLAAPEDPHGTGAIRRWFGPAPARVVTVSRWAEGLMLRPGLRVRAPTDLLRPGITVVNREVGAGSRGVFDRWLAQAGVPAERIRGYGRTLQSHLAVAEAVASGLADAGPGVLPVARAYGLEFLPVEERRYEVVVPEDLWGWKPVQRFLEVLGDRTFRQELARLGYDPTESGQSRVLR